MGKKKITCQNNSCNHYEYGNCNTLINLDGDGKCMSFEKGFAYYFHIVWNALDNKNFIDYVEMNANPDLRTGLFYVMECYDLGFSIREWGTCRFVTLGDGEGGNGLKYEEIIARELNEEKFRKHLENFRNGVMPGKQEVPEHKMSEAEQKRQEKEFGWLSPMGDFTESPFGGHEESAKQICGEKGFNEQYWEWRKRQKDGTRETLRRDFISSEKGYCLIHNPSGDGGYLVTHRKPLTRKQKNFLYGYFMDMGDRFIAEQYIED